MAPRVVYIYIYFPFASCLYCVNARIHDGAGVQFGPVSEIINFSLDIFCCCSLSLRCCLCGCWCPLVTLVYSVVNVTCDFVYIFVLCLMSRSLCGRWCTPGQGLFDIYECVCPCVCFILLATLFMWMLTLLVRWLVKLLMFFMFACSLVSFCLCLFCFCICFCCFRCWFWDLFVFF